MGDSEEPKWFPCKVVGSREVKGLRVEIEVEAEEPVGRRRRSVPRRTCIGSVGSTGSIGSTGSTGSTGRAALSTPLGGSTGSTGAINISTGLSEDGAAGSILVSTGSSASNFFV